MAPRNGRRVALTWRSTPLSLQDLTKGSTKWSLPSAKDASLTADRAGPTPHRPCRNALRTALRSLSLPAVPPVGQTAWRRPVLVTPPLAPGSKTLPVSGRRQWMRSGVHSGEGVSAWDQLAEEIHPEARRSHGDRFGRYEDPEFDLEAARRLPCFARANTRRPTRTPGASDPACTAPSKESHWPRRMLPTRERLTRRLRDRRVATGA
jgi:hypothetical protein